jgi:hypothetical protein
MPDAYIKNVNSKSISEQHTEIAGEIQTEYALIYNLPK